MKREAPTEREITDLIASVYEGWAEPDPRRLAAIEQRLLERPRRRVSIAWWWLVAALAVGAVSALWWAVNYDSAERQNQSIPEVVSPSEVPPPVALPAHPGRSEATESKSVGEPDRKNGPVIYQRER